MRVIFLTVIPSPYQRQLFVALGSAGEIECEAYYFTAAAHDREWKQPDLFPFEKILDGRTVASLGPSAHWNPDVMAEIDRAAPDLVVVSDYSALTAQHVMRRLARQGRPFVFWGEVPGFSGRGVLRSLIRRQLQAPLARSEAIVGIGSVAVDAYKALFPDKPVFNIPYFCDLAPFREARRDSRAPGETVDVLFSGQMIERKGLPILIAAFDRVARRHRRLRLLAVGDGPAQARYKATVPADLRERVIFLGHNDPKDLPAVFAAADIFCLPSRHDGWGVVVNEALGAGLPILVSDAVGAGRDLVTEGVNGHVTPAGDVEALAAVLDRLAGSADLRERMARASREAARHWDVYEGARRWTEAAKAILSDRRAA